LANAQAKSYQIAVSVFDTSATAIKGSVVKIIKPKSKLILAFTNLGSAHTANVSFSASPNDTVWLVVSKQGYETATSTLTLNQQTILSERQVTLLAASSTLADVTVTAPPVWTRGDTTFFKAEAFKLGDERKLIDIIRNMPGFSITPDGLLKFNGKLVDKVMIEGEELFADKVKLMLNSFPVHVLENVQALENQTVNKLLKGIRNDNLTWVNLSLKKGVKISLFGDADVGLGNADRYTADGTMFSVLQNLKAGIIANNNTLGTGFGFAESREIKPTDDVNAEKVMMQYNNLQIINNFESRRYIRNRLFDNRLQLNFSNKKKLSTKTEITLLNDRQKQNINYSSSLLTDTGFFNRIDTNRLKQQPQIIAINSTIAIALKPNKSLDLDINYYGNFTVGNRFNIYSGTSGLATDTITSRMENKWQSLRLAMQQTHRVSQTKAKVFKAYFHGHYYPQTEQFASPSLPAIFALPASYQLQQQRLNMTGYHAGVSYEWLGGKRKTPFGNVMYFSTQHYGLNNDSRFFSKNTSLPSLEYQPINNQGVYTSYLVSTKFSKTFNKGKIPMSLSGLLGWQHTLLTQNNTPSNFGSPKIQLETTTNLIKINRGLFKGSVNYTRGPQDLSDLNSVYFPAGNQTYQAQINPQIPQEEVNASVNFTHKSKNKKHQFSLGFLGGKRFTNPIGTFDYTAFVQRIADSFSRKPTNNYSINISHSFNSPNKKILVSSSVGGFYFQRLYLLAGNLLQTGYSQTVYADTRFNYKPNSVFSVDGNAHGSYASTGSTDVKNASTQQFANMRFGIKPRLVVIKKWIVNFNTEFIWNNIGSNREGKVFLLDAEFRYAPSKKPWSASILADNLTNQKRYFTNQVSPTSQSFYSVPLVPRNVLVKFQYQF
jgi:hypothetical protein